MRKFLLFVCVCALTVISALAQDDAEPVDCDDELIENAAVAIEELVAELREAEDPIAVLRELTQRSSRFIAACDNLVFTSEKEGLKPVIGPVVIPEGVYRVSITTTSGFTLIADVLAGECGEGSLMSSYIFTEILDEENDSAETVFYSTGCETLLTVGNTLDPWEMAFEKVR